MNIVYRLVFTRVLNAFVAVAENTGAACKNASLRRFFSARTLGHALAAVLGSVSFTPAVLALPTGGQVVAGQASVTQSGNGMTVHQNSHKAIIDWQGFLIGSGEQVSFRQPDGSSVALNRVLGSNASLIYGKLNANGQLFLVNPNGVYFGHNAEVNVGGLLASTLGISNQDFLSGNYQFNGQGAANVDNAGYIHAGQGGYVAFIGNQVRNTGEIVTAGGTTALGAGAQVTLTLADNHLVHFAVAASALKALAANSGIITADDGRVILSTQARDALLQTVVNNSGQIRARGVAKAGGTIQLLGGGSGTTRVAGTLDASAPASGHGGTIETSGAHVQVADDTTITTRAAHGGNGQWLIDPYDFTIAPSGGDITGPDLTAALSKNNVTIQTNRTNVFCKDASCGSGTSGGNGDINLDDTVSWSNTTLTFSAYRDINVNAALNGSGSAQLIFNYGQGTTDGKINGVTASYNVHAPINLPAGPNYDARLGSKGRVVHYTVITSLGKSNSSSDGSLQGMQGNLRGNYALGSDIVASETRSWNSNNGFAPVGSKPSHAFKGTFDGLGHTISDLYIDRPTSIGVGLFGVAGGSTIRDVGLVGGSVAGKTYVGDLVGKNANRASISNAYATGAITGNTNVGGLVGGNINHAKISNAYATGKVTGTGSNIGGLVGKNVNHASISNAYATGVITGNTNVGGLVGGNVNNAKISNTYATGKVVGAGGDVGGLAGSNDGTLTDGYWDTSANPSLGGVGLNNGTTNSIAGLSPTATNAKSNSLNAAGYPGFDFTSPTWVIYNGHTHPLLNVFLTPLTVTAANQTQPFTGNPSTATLQKATFSVPGAANSPHLKGLSSPYRYAVEPGTYVPDLWSDQQGYRIVRYRNARLTIRPRSSNGANGGSSTAAKRTDTGNMIASAQPPSQIKHKAPRIKGKYHKTQLTNQPRSPKGGNGGSTTATTGTNTGEVVSGAQRLFQFGFNAPNDNGDFIRDPLLYYQLMQTPGQSGNIRLTISDGGVNGKGPLCQ